MDLSVQLGNQSCPNWFTGLKGLPQNFDLIIVGAGISGCVFAEQASRRYNLKSLIIDKRKHIGGNCYDFINRHGIRISQYGVHLFHTKFSRVWKYVNNFSDWTPYEHRVKGNIKIGAGYRMVPIPPSQDTINAFTIFRCMMIVVVSFAKLLKVSKASKANLLLVQYLHTLSAVKLLQRKVNLMI